MCWEKRQVVQYISKMKVHLLLEKGGTKGKIPFNKQKKTRRKNTTTKRKDINEAIFTLSGLEAEHFHFQWKTGKKQWEEP